MPSSLSRPSSPAPLLFPLRRPFSSSPLSPFFFPFPFSSPSLPCPLLYIKWVKVSPVVISLSTVATAKPHVVDLFDLSDYSQTDAASSSCYQDAVASPPLPLAPSCVRDATLLSRLLRHLPEISLVVSHLIFRSRRQDLTLFGCFHLYLFALES